MPASLLIKILNEEKVGGWTLWSFIFWCLVMKILWKVITETATSDYSYPVRVSCDDSAINAPSTAHKDLWKPVQLLLELAKMKIIDKTKHAWLKKIFPKKTTASNWPFYRVWLWNRTFTTETRFQWKVLLSYENIIAQWKKSFSMKSHIFHVKIFFSYANI